jgi:hypothetical protein
MQTIDPKTLRFLALLSAPLFTVLSSKLGVAVPVEVQEMLVGTVALYILGSHSKEAIVKAAEAKGAAAAANVTTVEQANEAIAKVVAAQVTP